MDCGLMRKDVDCGLTDDASVLNSECSCINDNNIFNDRTLISELED